MWSKERLTDFLKSRQLPSEGPPGAPSVVIPIETPISSSSVSSSINPQQNADSQTPIVAITAASLALIVAFIFAFYILRHCREVRNASGHKSNNFPKSLWSKTKFFPKHRNSSINERLEPPVGENSLEATNPRPLEMAENFDRPDRAASFRSVITLPSYIPDARQDEQVLGREGERGGIDVVLEFPNTADEEERRREEEMEALYQVRLARRRENELREDRRRARSTTREHGESSTLREIEEGRRSVNDTLQVQSIDELRATHDRLKNNRHRKVSIVSYAEIGVARHDGSRLNPGTPEVEQSEILGDAPIFSTNVF